MRIECPHCKASGNINDLEIPDEGMYIACPRCKTSFQVKKPRKKMTSPYATNTCPACGYSTFCEEVFDDCPKCGVVVKTLVEKKRAAEQSRRDMEVLNRSYSTAAPPPPPPPKAPLGSKYTRHDDVVEKPRITLASFANGFDPVAAVGWGAGLLAAVMLFVGILGLMDYHGTDIQAQLSAKSVEPVSAWEVFWGYGFLPWIETVFGIFTLIAVFGFLQREEWGGKAMESVLIASLVLAPLYELIGYVIWIVRSVSPPWWAYLVELFSALLFALLWALPLFFLVRYLRGVSFRRSYGTKI